MQYFHRNASNLISKGRNPLGELVGN